MDPTITVPAHFTLEILSVVATGLVCAWAIYEKRWIAAGGAAVFAVAQALHAGSFLAGDDDTALIVLRLVGVALIAAGAYDIRVRREPFLAGLALLLGGAIWGAVSGGSAAQLTIGPHVMNAVGAIALLWWTWFVTRPSVRLRLLVSFVLVLGVAVIVTGGSVSRVAAVEKRDEEYGKLGPTAAVVRQQLAATATDLATRAAAFSPQTAPKFSDRTSLRGAPLRSGEFAATFDPKGKAVAGLNDGSIPYAVTTIPRMDAFRAATGGNAGTGYRVSHAAGADGLGIVGTAPVFRPGGSRSGSDVLGVIAFAHPLTIGEIQQMVVAVTPEAEVALGQAGVGSVSTISSKDITRAVAGAAGTSFRTISTPTGDWPAVITPIDGSPGVDMMIALPAARVVDATRTLVRSFLIALLAAALLAVVVALWLSARITRPMLDLVEQSERLKTDFLASVSHELRTPLTPIRGYTEILRRGRVPARRASGYLDEIGQAAQRLERIVSLLVDVAAMEANRYHVNIDDVAANDLVRDVAARWEQVSSDHPIRTELDGATDVKADPVAIGRVLDELVDNAIKFSPDGSAVTVAAETGDGGVTFSVRDQGQGIDPARLAELGGAFEQIDSGDTRRFGGLGLGLNYVRGVLKIHNSRLELSSGSKGGTTSAFTLPTGTVSRMSAKAQRSRKASKSKAR